MKSTRLNLAWGTNELPELQPHWEKWLSRANKKEVFQPAGFFGLPDLKQAIADRFKSRYGFRIQPKQVTITNGGTEALYTIFQWLSSIGGQVILQEPAWGYFKEALALLDIPVQPSVAENADQLKIELEALDSRKPTLFLLTQPSNPLCQIFSRDYLEVLSDWVNSKEQHFVLSDEIYDWYAREQDHFHSWSEIHGLGSSFIVHGYSKPTGLASWRVGYFIAPISHLRALNTFHMNNTYGTASMSQFIALEAQYEEEEIRKLLHHAIDKRRKLLSDKWEQDEDIALINEGVGMYSFVTLPWDRSKQEAFFNTLREKGELMVTPGYSFGIETGGMRLNLTRSIAQLEEAIDVIQTFLRKA
jgi:aspartate aminotransferase